MTEYEMQEIKGRLTDYVQSVTSKSKGGLYICPLCGSGTGTHKTGAFGIYDNGTKWKCQACGKYGDIFDLIGECERISDQGQQFKRAAEFCGIDISRDTPPDAPGRARSDFKAKGDESSLKGTNKPQDKPQAAKQADFSGYLAKCRERLNSPDALRYLESRGISYGVAAGCGLGYDPAADPANNPGGTGKSLYPTGRIIVPFDNGGYMGRAVNPGAKLAKANAKGNHADLFNTAALYDYETDSDTVFITEGVFDALSVIEAGAAAIALNSTSNAQKLIEKLDSFTTTKTMVLCLDSDEAGKRAEEVLRQGLGRLNVSYTVADITGPHKDPNEALTADRDGFFKAVQKAMHDSTARPDNVAHYIDNLLLQDIKAYGKRVKTGFDHLDRKTGGGIFPGVYVIAAPPSLGKTTFCTQMADNMATAGNDVLYFSIEQSKLELVSKCISRRTADRFFKSGLTSTDIIEGKNAAAAAAKFKDDVGDRLSIIEGNFNCTIPFIGDYIRRYISKTGAKPVVFIDYLQILRQEVDKNRRHQDIREIIDDGIRTLKQLSRELSIIVIAISSVNRSNYYVAAGYESFKESGGIEFTADGVWGLQLTCVHWPEFENRAKGSTATGETNSRRTIYDKEKSKVPREIEMSVLKNRRGEPTFMVYFKYYANYETFVPASFTEMNLDGSRKKTV